MNTNSINNNNGKGMYKLFVGFEKLGEFTTIKKAKKFADNSERTGVFNLLGDKYRESWYVCTYLNKD